jgi:hypothetical protein
MPETHIVGKNDGLNNLSTIAEHYGVSWSELVQTNPQLKNRKPAYWLNPGDKVQIPTKRWSNQNIKSCKSNCPIYYLLVIKINLASGQARNGRPMTAYTLPNAPHEVVVELFYDFQDANYSRQQVPVDGQLIYKRGQTDPLVRVITKGTFYDLKKLLVWAPGMTASFRKLGLHENFAVGRIELPRARMKEEDATQHPTTGVFLPKGSKKLTVDVDILEHPAHYILSEMIRNSHSNDVPTDESYDNVGFGLLGARWGLRAANGQDWDYKTEARIRGVWGSLIRLGNHAHAVHNEGFSNFHYGYVAAVGGLTLADTLRISEIGGWVSSRDTPADIYAMTAGHSLFLNNNGGVIWVREREVQTVMMMSPSLVPVQVPTSAPTGKERLVDLTKQQQRSRMERKAPNSTLLRPIYEGYDYRYTRQPIAKEPVLSSVTSFLLAYLQLDPR